MKIKCDTVVADFDRTMIYLYRDTSLLLSLAQMICKLYSDHITVEPSYYEMDGYLAWHALHAKAEKELPSATADKLNRQAEELVTDFEKKVISTTDMFDGIAETVEKLSRRGIGFHIVSNNAESAIRYALSKEGIENLFGCVIGRPYPFDPTKVKPSPYLINKIIDQNSLDRSRVLYIGDDIMDMEAATGARVLPVGVTTGRHSAQQLEAHGAKIVLSDFNKLSNILVGQ